MKEGINKMGRNKKYTEEFRESAARLVVEGEEGAPKIASDLGINEKTLYNWISAYKRVHNIDTRNNKKDHKMTLEEENKKLIKENRVLKQERDILKKATAYFAKQTL